MQLILETIRNALTALQEPLPDLVAMFPGTIITISIISILVRKQVLVILENFKK